MTGDPVIYAVRHLPGSAWKPGVDPRSQPGIGEHAAHYAGLLAEGKLLIGGPFLDEDRGGMAVAMPGVGREELESFAASDPEVAKGLIRYEIWTWFAAMRCTELDGR